MDSPAALAALLEIQGDSLIPPPLLERLAEDTRALTTDPAPAALVEAAGATLVMVDDLPSHLDGMTVGSRIYVQRRIDFARVLLAIFHELAHWLLRDTWHTHADVWRLAIALGAPRSLLAVLRAQDAANEVGLASASGLPRWAVLLRLEMAGAENDGS